MYNSMAYSKAMCSCWIYPLLNIHDSLQMGKVLPNLFLTLLWQTVR